MEPAPSLYLNAASSQLFAVPYDNAAATARIAKSALLRALRASRSLDDYHRQTLDQYPGDPVLVLQGSGYGWWLIQSAA